MRKIIAIGESVVDTVFSGGKPLAAFIGGRIANTAASLGAMGLPVSMVSECGTDSVGQMVVDFLSEHRVDVKSIDRFTEGSTAFSAIFKTPGEADKIVNYCSYPHDRFDVIWPRIDEGDIGVFGSLCAIDLPQRERLFELVSYASERKAIIIYLPGFQHGINFRITRVMPNILENLEISDIVIAHNRDINDIFPGESCEEAFRNHIEFVANEGGASTNLLGWQAGFTAGIVSELCRLDIGRDELKTLDDEVWQGITAAAFKCAAVCAAQSDNCVTADFAAECQSQLAQAEAERQKQ